MLTLILLFALWALLHSVTASAHFKATVRARIGARAYDGSYRLIYNALSVATLAPVLLAGAMTIPHVILWEVSRPLDLLFVGVQLLGLVGLGISLIQTDLMRFLGVSQLIRYLGRESEINPDPILITGGAYRIVRHPLYFFSLLLLWFTPIMTLSILLFNLLATSYFWIGSGYEEKRLEAVFGEQYRAYRKRVPRLIPARIR